MHRTYSGLWGDQASIREGKVRDIKAILGDKGSTGEQGMGGESWVYTQRIAEGRREATDREGGRTGSGTGSSGWS